LDPPLAQRDWVEVVNTIASPAFGGDETGVDEDPEVLHDRETAYLRELGGELTGRRGRVAELVQKASSPRAGECTPDIGLGGGTLNSDTVGRHVIKMSTYRSL
jgi:hypothetical protein